MIIIKEISVEQIIDFWGIHIKYLIDDEIILDKEDIEYFSQDEYRSVIVEHMKREKDKHHIVYFIENDIKIGAAQYTIYQSQNGKCFILDFWVFEKYRGKGMGYRCFHALEKYTKDYGALYYELNSEKENAIRFWKKLGFTENGKDEWGMKLFVRK